MGGKQRAKSAGWRGGHTPQVGRTGEGGTRAAHIYGKKGGPCGGNETAILSPKSRLIWWWPPVRGAPVTAWGTRALAEGMAL